MAFPVPNHLPRKAEAQDVTSTILTKMNEATNKTLNAALAKSWLNELDETIRGTKQSLHDRIQADYPQFQHQLETSVSLQERLKTLRTNVDELGNTISNPETGLVLKLLDALKKHSTLAKEETGARIRRNALEHLSQCHKEFKQLVLLSATGDLPQVIQHCDKISTLIHASPSPLDRSSVIDDLKRRYTAIRARTEELLSDAFGRSITVSAHGVSIRDSVQVLQSEKTLTLSEIMSSLSPGALSNHLSTLRRDITTHLVETLFRQPMSLSSETELGEHKLACFPSPPNDEVLPRRLTNLAAALDFLSEHLFIHLPQSQQASFPRTLCKSVTTNILNALLIPSLPNSFSELPSFLELVQETVSFEKKYVIGLLGNDEHDEQVRHWAAGVGGHYERRRRTSILDESRQLILEPDNLSDTFPVTVEISLPHDPPVVVQQPLEEEDPPSSKSDDDAWGLDSSDSPEVDGWGFNDEEEQDDKGTDAHEGNSGKDVDEEEPDPGAAWGWNDEEEESLDSGDATDESAWDDPWGDSSTSSEPVDVRPPPAPSLKTPKAATRLEKLANKGKKAPSTSTSNSSPELVQAVSSSSSPPSPEKVIGKKPANLSISVPRETYVVSSRMHEVVKIVNNVLRESQELKDSNLTTTTDSSASQPGSILLRTTTSVLDLYRALYPAVFSAQLRSIEGPIRYSNNCLYLSQELERIAASSDLKELADCGCRFKILGDSWYADAIEKYRLSVDKIISEASGFEYTSEQERYDDCETAMNNVLKEIRRLQRWKNLLTKSKYYMAIGLVTDAALSRVLRDIIALPDIPEVESHRLSELCRILHSLEGLFVEDPEQPSFVVAYVPSWLKFSYLSELMEASMADTTYLFETGALVDFEIDELVRLVKALFSDTPLRANAINKLLEGHPSISDS